MLLIACVLQALLVSHTWHHIKTRDNVMNMKALLASAVFAGSSLMAANAQALVATTPEQAVKEYFSALEKGDEATVFDLVQLPPLPAQLPEDKRAEIQHSIFQDMQSSLKQEGGIKSMNVSPAKKASDANHMTVHVKATTNNGDTQETDMPVVKVGKGWKLGQ